MLNDVPVAVGEEQGERRRGRDPFSGQAGVEAVAVGLWRRRAARATSASISVARAEIRGPVPPVRARTEEAK